ncbi:MAG: SAVED domain-containing protein [Proteobacteria bacterium]|nr:SAVED domain-containing protein [Pseudomonadota bacterium]
MDELIRGLLIIKHEYFRPITNEECILALPEEWKNLNREFISVAGETLRLNELYDAPQVQIALAQRDFFKKPILERLEALPGYKILYFGLAPIPLAIDLGYQFHNFRDIEAFQFHHVEKRWYQNSEHKAIQEFKVVTDNLPNPKQKGISELALRVSISHHIKSQDTNDVLPNAAEVDLGLTEPNEDAISTKEEMTAVAEEFKKVMDNLASNESNIEVIHLFASVPVGVAFIMGTKISPNIHPFVQTYQHSAIEKPRYINSVLVKGEIDNEIALTDEDLKTADELRAICNDELKGGIRKFAYENATDSRGRAWYLGLMPQLADGIMDGKFWKNLPSISETSLKGDEIDFDLKTVADGFFWKLGKWYVDDHFYVSVKKRIENLEAIKKANRLFLFHEALHYHKHKLTTATANNIGSFPKVLETADYQADVFGILNEYSYANKAGYDVSDVKKFFLHSIDIATETMWSFDDRGKQLEEMQIRRVSRYLIWYWQYVLIEKFGNILDEIVRILEEKPVIEINGLKTKELNNRFFYDLNKRNSKYLEIGIFKDNEVVRHGSASNMPIESLVEGLKQMNGELIKEVLRSFRDA